MADASAAAGAAEALADAVERADLRGWDPYDALASPIVRSAARTPLLRRLAIQTVKRAPVNVRPILGVPRLEHTKALALLATAYATFFRLGWGEHARALALDLGNRLRDRSIERRRGVAWGYDFDVQTRWGYYPAREPNAVVTSFVVRALLDLLELEEDPERRALVDQAVSFVCDELVAERFFRYYPGSTVPIHNASLLVADALWRATRDADARAAATAAVHYTVERQRPDGSWPYGEPESLEWVDGFHTAYVLECLVRIADSGGPAEASAAAHRGLDFYLARLIDPDGAARATPERRFPVDIHAASSAVACLSRLADFDARTLPTASRVLSWTFRTMQRRDGRYAFQLHAHRRRSIPYIRWGDAHMLVALGEFLSAVRARTYG